MDFTAAFDPDPLPPKVVDGKDELNLAEFPLSALADRLQPDQQTLVFEDRVWDANRGEIIARQLSITASAEYGLPTALDDEVILGLIQLSKLRGFADRRVSFTRYQLIQLLGWRNETKSYERIEKSLNRLVGVTFYYQNAWWDRKQQGWVDEKFHILDNVTLFHRDQPPRIASVAHEASRSLSSFAWNEVLFRSFRAGNLKSLDFDFYKSLDGAIAKRLYRFLDKRFFHRKRWEFNLKELAWEHVGLSRNYDCASLKRKLQPAIEELERRRFLRPISEKDRFRKISSGEWRALFEAAQSQAPVPQSVRSNGSTALRAALMERGVSPTIAQDTVTQYPQDRIRNRLEVFDWLVAQRDVKVSKNPPGFLVASIRGEYAPPRDFVSRQQSEQRAKEAADRQRRSAERRQRQEAAREAKAQSREDAVKLFWQSLSEEERWRLETEALNRASPVRRKYLEHGGSLGEAARKAILDAYALNLMQAGA